MKLIDNFLNNITMYRLVLWFLVVLGVVGLIYAGVSYLNGGEGTRNIKFIIIAGILGAIFFFAGISLVRNTKDKAT